VIDNSDDDSEDNIGGGASKSDEQGIFFWVFEIIGIKRCRATPAEGNG